MRTQNFLCAMSLPLALSVALSACVTPSAPTDNLAGDRPPQTSQNNQRDRPQSAADKSEAVICDRPDAALKPLSAPENMPVFEQFNFTPQEISVASGKVAVKTPYYTFSLCRGADKKSARRKNARRPPIDH